MSAVAKQLNIVGRNPARTWQRYETGERNPPLGIVVKVEAMSEGLVTSASWLQVQQAFRRKQATAQPSV